MSVHCQKQPRHEKPVAVLFDLDDTLYAYAPCNSVALQGVFEAVTKRYDIAINDVAVRFDDARAAVKGRLGIVSARHSRLLYFHEMLEALGLGSQVEEALRLEQIFWRRYLVEMRLFPGASDFLRYLKSCGLRLGLVTDLTAQIQFRKLCVLGIADMFDAVVTSEEVSGEKETCAPFDRVAQKLGIATGDYVWMIGDNDVDVAGAKSALGAMTLLFTGGSGQVGSAVPDITFDAYGPLREAVHEWFGSDSR